MKALQKISLDGNKCRRVSTGGLSDSTTALCGRVSDKPRVLQCDTIRAFQSARWIQKGLDWPLAPAIPYCRIGILAQVRGGGATALSDDYESERKMVPNQSRPAV
jgi:hypothetical protein